MDIVLIPGMWLDGSSWDRVLPALERAGHRPHALTLPGLESPDADRSSVTLADHVAAVVAAVDAVPAGDPVVVVGHSMGAALAYAAVDARPDRIVRAIYVGGFPAEDGDILIGGYQASDGEIPLPSWSEFEEEELDGLDDAERARFRESAVPTPEKVARGTQSLSDDRRFAVPVTMICTEFSAAQLQAWIEAGEPPVREFRKFADAEYVDLPTGHWPQFSRPEDLASVIASALDRTTSDVRVRS